ncbi:hypothetical protein [Neptuniibacter sp. CAU 1671]|uniref:hypothetical protein n=1 Tax=Neptuniibacter sp. CAU 1671 TaxID=3032593 RepID=UPI0023DC6749|nr:hypothetical protein [Neptuniibacter sp. CAU 1671]MDF2182124.1 hypothetical protein [Neptuniibacter sp. CAU 1671]
MLRSFHLTELLYQTNMLYAIRNSEGHIISLSEAKLPDSEPVALQDEEVLRFLAIGNDAITNGDFLENSDLGIARILEDLIEVLVGKNLIMFTDLPEPAQKKLLSRKLVRNLKNPDGSLSEELPGASFLIEEDDSF